MGDLSSGFMCVNPECDLVFAIDPGDCACGATSFIRVGEAVPGDTGTATGSATASPFLVCPRADCGQPVPAHAAVCPYCGAPVTASASPELDEQPGARSRASAAALVAADGSAIPLRSGTEIVLGRSPEHSPWSRLVEASSGVSRRHASVSVARGVLHVRDLGSANGTWVNGIRIDGAAELELTDGIRIGLGRRFELVVKQQ